MKKKLKIVFIVLLIAVVIAAIACGAYFVTLKIQEKKALATIDSMFTALKSGDEETIKKYIHIEESNNTTSEETSNDEDSIMDDENMTKAMVQNINYEVV